MNKQVVVEAQLLLQEQASDNIRSIQNPSIRLVSCMHNQANGNLSTILLTAVYDNLSTTLLKLEGEVDDKLYY